MVIEKLIPSVLSRAKNRVFSQVLEPNYRHTLKARAKMNKYCAILAVSMYRSGVCVLQSWSSFSFLRSNAVCERVHANRTETSALVVPLLKRRDACAQRNYESSIGKRRRTPIVPEGKR